MSGLGDRRQMAISPGKSGGKSLHLKPSTCAKAGQSNSPADPAGVTDRKGRGKKTETVGTIHSLKGLYSEWSLCWRLLSLVTMSTEPVAFRNTLHSLSRYDKMHKAIICTVHL